MLYRIIDPVPFAPLPLEDEHGGIEIMYDFLDGSLFSHFYYDYLILRCYEADRIREKAVK